MAFGPHVSRCHAPGARPPMAAHLEAARLEAETESGFRIGAAAIFVGGPQNRVINLRPEERAPLRAWATRAGVRLVAHSSYTAPPWRGDPDAARYIREELAVCAEAGIAGLVVHLPKAPPATVAQYLPRLVNPEARGVRVYLETPAVRPAESHYETPEKLAALFHEIRAVDPGLDHFGLCVDTAHLWTCGVDLRAYADADRWLRRLEAALPPSCVMFHLNDSARPRGVGPDAHAPLGAGHIWRAHAGHLAESGLAAFVDYAVRHDAVCILERKPKEALHGDYLALRQLVHAPPAADAAPAGPSGGDDDADADTDTITVAEGVGIVAGAVLDLDTAGAALDLDAAGAALDPSAAGAADAAGVALDLSVADLLAEYWPHAGPGA